MLHPSSADMTVQEDVRRMSSTVISGAIYGVEARPVRVETFIAATIPSFHIVGLPDNAVRESRERVYAAIKNSGFKFPPWRITINLAPANLPKAGSAFDLPIAVGILAAIGVIRKELLDSTLLLAELALDGSLMPVDGVIVVAAAARGMSLPRVVISPENIAEASMIGGIDLPEISNLRETAAYLNGQFRPEPGRFAGRRRAPPPPIRMSGDFSDVKGQESAKRAMEIAAAGRHNILLVGPPGSGKTMLASRLPSILPKLSQEEALETRKIQSVAGLLKAAGSADGVRPFRAPHHSISPAALVGGGSTPRPGEISLAHNGVLFLDELPEFARNVLEALRQPLEEGRITVSRARYSVDYPARLLLVCAMNRCLCGYFTDPGKECTCAPMLIRKYMAKISGPLLDRIDLHIEVPAVKYNDLTCKDSGEHSSDIRARVVRAREVQLKRFDGRKGMFCNADMQSKDIQSDCRLDNAGEELLGLAITKLGLSARAYDRILKVGRTIADLSQSSAIQPQHISEAIQYRSLDRNL